MQFGGDVALCQRPQDESAAAQEAQFATAVQTVTDTLGPDDERLIHLASSVKRLERPAIGNAVRVGPCGRGWLGPTRGAVASEYLVIALIVNRIYRPDCGVSYGSQFICDLPACRLCRSGMLMAIR